MHSKLFRGRAARADGDDDRRGAARGHRDQRLRTQWHRYQHDARHRNHDKHHGACLTARARGYHRDCRGYR
jgi:hypothetical protein